MPDNPTALKPEDLTRLFVERANAGDAAGIAALLLRLLDQPEFVTPENQ